MPNRRFLSGVVYCMIICICPSLVVVKSELASYDSNQTQRRKIVVARPIDVKLVSKRSYATSVCEARVVQLRMS